MTGKQLDEVGLAGKIPGIPGPEFRLAWVMPQAGGLMGSGKWRHPQVRVAAAGPLGCRPFWPLDDGEKWILECGECRGVQPEFRLSFPLQKPPPPRFACFVPPPLLRLPGLS